MTTSSRTGSGNFQQDLTRDVTQILTGAKDIVSNYEKGTWKTQGSNESTPNTMVEKSYLFAKQTIQQYSQFEKDIGVNPENLVTH